MSSNPYTPAISIGSNRPSTVTAAHNIYRYEQLDTRSDTIRILLLHPSNKAGGNDTLRCELVPISFRQKPIYEALSYTWGEGKPTHCIIIDGICVPVRYNLYNALLHLRSPTKPRMLWVDALCINQNDDGEKSYQVGLMDYIYTRAAAVIVWLGSLPDNVKSERRRFHEQEEMAFPRRNGPNWWTWMEFVLKNSYWNRLWIIQEIGLSRNLFVQIERHSMLWKQFLELTESAYHTYSSAGYQADSMSRLGLARMSQLSMTRSGRNGEVAYLENLIESHQTALCFMPVDKIYGLLGLANDCIDDKIIAANYEKRPQEVYLDVMNYFWNRSLSLRQSGKNGDLDRSMRAVNFSKLVQNVLGIEDPSSLPDMSSKTKATMHVVRARVVGVVTGNRGNLEVKSRRASTRWLCFSKRKQPVRQQNSKMQKEVSIRQNSSTILEQDSIGFLSQVPWISDPRQWTHQDTEPDMRQANRAAEHLFKAQTLRLSSKMERAERVFLMSEEGTHLRSKYDVHNGDIVCAFWSKQEDHNTAKSQISTDFQKPGVVILRRDGEEGYYRIVGKGFLNKGGSHPRDVGAQTMVMVLETSMLSYLSQ